MIPSQNPALPTLEPDKLPIAGPDAPSLARKVWDCTIEHYKPLALAIGAALPGLPVPNAWLALPRAAFREQADL